MSAAEREYPDPGNGARRSRRPLRDHALAVAAFAVGTLAIMFKRTMLRLVRLHNGELWFAGASRRSWRCSQPGRRERKVIPRTSVVGRRSDIRLSIGHSRSRLHPYSIFNPSIVQDDT
jgi:hypothetical protein